MSRDGGLEQLTDELVGLVCDVVRRPEQYRRGRAWMVLEENQELIGGWVKADVPLTKVQVLLARRGCRCRIARCTVSPPNAASTGPG